jgi:perosamine synthetase
MTSSARGRPFVLAINGGVPVMQGPLDIHNVGQEEIDAAIRVIRQGPLSGFAAVAGDRFLGGTEVRAFEREFSEKFGARHSVGFNSATTALHAAVVALGVGPGDEVILPPYTMSASATAVMMNGAVPIFADIDAKTFCIDPKSVEARITQNTKAIMAVDLFGQPSDFGALLPIARRHGLKVIEDNAQSPGARWCGRAAGTIGDIGIFSLNLHKTMQTGEGGILVTNDDTFALRAQLARNHGEVVVDDMPNYAGGPIFGSNYRMTEIVAAMARVQLKRLDTLVAHHRAQAALLTKALSEVPGLTPAYVHPDNYHVFHRFAITVDEGILGISRDTLVAAMRAEGFPMSKGYVKPIYLLPVFQTRRAFNNTSFPFEFENYDGNPDYSKGLCPVAERLYEREFTFTDVVQYPYTEIHVELFIAALKKVVEHKDELLKLGRRQDEDRHDAAR